MRRVLIVASSALLALGVAACGTETLEQEDLQTQIQEDLSAQAGAELQSVSCPDDVESSEGTEFSCTGVAPNGDEFAIEGTVTNDEGGFEATVPPEQFQNGG
jgi:hypothetical protein